MRFYTRQHRHYCGIDLHARTMYVCILDADGNVVVHANLPSSPAAFRKVIAPYRDDLIVGVECSLSWYWLADVCAQDQIAMILGHALYMRAIHGAKTKNDKIDSRKIATLLRGGAFPVAYAYPAEMRGTRDLLRRRLHFVRIRGEMLAHIQMTHHQYNLPSPGKRIAYAANRVGLTDGFSDPAVVHSIATDQALIDRYDELIGQIELEVIRAGRVHDPQAYARLKTIPGVGNILALTVLYEVHDIGRFPSVRDFASYCRLIRCPHESAGKIHGSGGGKIGNVHLKWAFSEAAVLFIAKSPDGHRVRQRLVKQHGKKALSVLAHRLGRAAYYMLTRKQAFDAERFAQTI